MSQETFEKDLLSGIDNRPHTECEVGPEDTNSPSKPSDKGGCCCNFSRLDVKTMNRLAASDKSKLCSVAIRIALIWNSLLHVAFVMSSTGTPCHSYDTLYSDARFFQPKSSRLRRKISYRMGQPYFSEARVVQFGEEDMLKLLIVAKEQFRTKKVIPILRRHDFFHLCDVHGVLWLAQET